MEYSVKVSHFTVGRGFTDMYYSVEAETLSEAKHRAFRRYRLAVCPRATFKWFMENVLTSIKEESE